MLLIILTWIIIFILIIYTFILYQYISSPDYLPALLSDEYWGPGEVKDYVPNADIVPFQIKFTEEMIKDLKFRLTGIRYTDALEKTHFDYGMHHATLKDVVEFWKNEYDFEGREKHLNRFPQFKTNIQGLDIHFIHVKPVMCKDVVPLLLLHGWPGSVVEFYKVIEILQQVENRDFAFEIVVPSLPGFGFSQGASKVGLGTSQMAVIMMNLMKRLGLKDFYIQGTDWGSAIGSNMAVLFPSHILGFHSNFPSSITSKGGMKIVLGSLLPFLVIEKRFRNRLYPLTEKLKYLIEETGYFHQQATRPDTIGVILDNSPVGLASWILERFAAYTDKNYKIYKNGGLTKNFKLEELIDNLMFYWVPKSATTSARIYAESFSKKHMDLGLDNIPTNVPTAIARFPNEVIFATKCVLKDKYPNLLQITDFAKGGHFPAMEEPELLAKDLELAIVKFRLFHLDKKNKDRF